jgi:hypothetical protein
MPALLLYNLHFSASVDIQCHDCHYCVCVLFYSCFNHYFGLSGRRFVLVFLSELYMNMPQAMSFSMPFVRFRHDHAGGYAIFPES